MESIYNRYRKLKKEIRDLAAIDVQRLYRGYKNRLIYGKYKCSYKLVSHLMISVNNSSSSTFSNNNSNNYNNSNNNTSGSTSYNYGSYKNTGMIGNYDNNNICDSDNNINININGIVSSSSNILRKYELNGSYHNNNSDNDSVASIDSDDNISENNNSTFTTSSNFINNDSNTSNKIPANLYISYKKLLDQKRDLKRKLKKFDEDFYEKFHRNPKKNDKEIIRPMYQTYHEVRNIFLLTI